MGLGGIEARMDDTPALGLSHGLKCDWAGPGGRGQRPLALEGGGDHLRHYQQRVQRYGPRFDYGEWQSCATGGAIKRWR